MVYNTFVCPNHYPIKIKTEERKNVRRMHARLLHLFEQLLFQK